MLRIACRAMLALIALLAIGLAFSAWRYSREMDIDDSRGVSEAGYVRIGALDQWVQIRGSDRTNPVLLWLNGGPGFSTIAHTPLFRRWEQHFTVVMWDQRGEGRTFLKSGPAGTGPMTIERMAQDGIELAEYLRRHLHQDKVIVLGHSWGSLLGVRMVKARPDLFAAYVATGQITSEAAMMAHSWPLLLARARALGNQAAVEQLTAAGPPPWQPLQKSLAWLIWSNALDTGELRWPVTAAWPWARIRNEIERRKQRAGTEYSHVMMARTLLEAEVLSLGYQFEVPVVFIQGSEDLAAVTALTQQYFERITAPRKSFVLLQGAGHSALFYERDAFLDALIGHARFISPASAHP